MWQHLNPKPNI